MVKKKTISKEFIIEKFMDYVLQHGQYPPTVYQFAKDNNFEEHLFYHYYGSFNAVEKDIFIQFFDNTLKTLMLSEDYLTFDARGKLLSFYFTFFENLTVNRSFVIYALNKHDNKLKNLKVVSGLRHRFKNYIEQLNIEKINLESEKLSCIQDKSMSESAWLQLLMTLKFWMDDESPNFEKTDIFIEKSINTSFDLINTQPIKSLLDFGKFVWKERVNMKM